MEKAKKQKYIVEIEISSNYTVYVDSISDDFENIKNEAERKVYYHQLSPNESKITKWSCKEDDRDGKSI